MRRPDAVIFDMDGVIFDSERLCLECWEQLAQEHGFVGMQKAFLKCTGTTVEETRRIMLEHFGEAFDYDGFARQASVLFHKIEEEQGLPMKPGVVELLEMLQKENIPVGLASSTRLQTVERQLKAAGIYDFFQVVIGGDQLKKSKPEPDIYLMACKEMKVSPENAYAIEDSFNGIRSACAAGMKAIMVPDLVAPDEEMKEKSTLIVTDLLQLKEYLCNGF